MLSVIATVSLAACESTAYLRALDDCMGGLNVEGAKELLASLGQTASQFCAEHARGESESERLGGFVVRADANGCQSAAGSGPTEFECLPATAHNLGGAAKICPRPGTSPALVSALKDRLVELGAASVVVSHSQEGCADTNPLVQ